jgi:hypothetical protein
LKQIQGALSGKDAEIRLMQSKVKEAEDNLNKEKEKCKLKIS